MRVVRLRVRLEGRHHDMETNVWNARAPLRAQKLDVSSDWKGDELY
jgi:hypothetical protein